MELNQLEVAMIEEKMAEVAAEQKAELSDLSLACSTVGLADVCFF